MIRNEKSLFLLHKNIIIINNNSISIMNKPSKVIHFGGNIKNPFSANFPLSRPTVKTQFHNFVCFLCRCADFAFNFPLAILPA